MSKDIVLYSLLKRTFALLLGNENLGENCEFLVQKLDVRIQELRRCGLSNELLASLSNLKGGFVSLRACFKYLTDDTAEARFAESDFKEVPKQASASDEVSKYSYQYTETENPVREKTKQTNDSEDNDRLLSCPKDATLQKELREIKESDKLKLAMEYFRQSNAFSAKAFEKENNGDIKITAAKVRIISEILGNLTNLGAAADNCRKYISQLDHKEILNLHNIFLNLKNALQVRLLNYPKKEGSMVSVIHINVVVFRFMKEFTRKPVVMLDWPMIDGQDPKKYHPILGELPTEIDPPDPFTQITDINKDKVQIESCISAINCSGDIFAKEKASKDIVRITPNCNKWYSLNDDSGRKIVSIAIDCTDCKTSTESQHGETSTQPCTASSRLTSLVCHGKMYILARSKSQDGFHYFLYVVDMNGKTEHSKKLGYLQRSTTEFQTVKIFCISGQKLVILEFTRGATSLRICNNEGGVEEKINMTAELRNPLYVSSIAYNGEIVCSNGESMLNIYNINEKRGTEKPPSKTTEIEIKRTVQAVAYNHELEEFIILCYVRASLKLEYYLVTYTKAGQSIQLIQDIKLNNANHEYEKAKLICHQNGPAVLLDNHKLLYLKR